jgi:hypothetical protein
MNYKRQLLRLKERAKAMSFKHAGRERLYTYHGGFDLGYLQGQISILEEIVDDMDETYG